MKIKATHQDFYYECGDGCCSEYGTRSKIQYGDKVFDYTGLDPESNLLQFISEELDIQFEEEYEDSDYRYASR